MNAEQITANVALHDTRAVELLEAADHLISAHDDWEGAAWAATIASAHLDRARFLVLLGTD